MSSNVTLHPVICCPSCGARIEIAAKEVQAELPGLLTVCRAGASPAPATGAVALQLRTRKEICGLSEKKLDEKFGSSLKSGGSVPVPLQKSDSSNDSNRIGLSEEDLIESIRDIVGEYEWGLNGQLWRCYFQSCPDALRYAVRKWTRLSPVQQRSTKNRAAKLTYHYKCARDEITKASGCSGRRVACGTEGAA